MSERITKTPCCPMTWLALAIAALAAVGFLFSAGPSRAADAARSGDEFSSQTIDVGIVVSDIEESADFYTDAIGFTQIGAFTVSAQVAGDAGLTDDQPLDIRVFALGDSPDATKIKLMQLPGVPSEKADQDFIHSTLGYSYMTIHVNDTTAALERLEQAGAKPLAQGPVALPGTDLYLTLVKDPDGNFVELLGPKK